MLDAIVPMSESENTGIGTGGLGSSRALVRVPDMVVPCSALRAHGKAAS